METTNPNEPERDRDLPFMISAMDERRVALYDEGGWYSVTGDEFSGHFFMCANPKSDVAISMCATQIVPIHELHPPVEGRKCMVCSVYESSGKGGDYQARMERRRQHAARAMQIHERIEQAKLERKNDKSKPRKGK